VLCQEETERANAKRDLTWMKEQLKREQLMADVFAGRQEQIVYKNEGVKRRELEIDLGTQGHQ
jgi:hypothetical protein